MTQKIINQAAMKVLNERLARPDGPVAFNSGDESRFIKVLVRMADDEIRAWPPEDVIATAKDLSDQKGEEAGGYEDSFRLVADTVAEVAVTYGDRWWNKKISEVAKDISREREGVRRYFWVYKKYDKKKTTLYLGADAEEAAYVALHPEVDPFPKAFDDTIFMEYKDIPPNETEGLMGDEVMGVWKKLPGGEKIPRAVWWDL